MIAAAQHDPLVTHNATRMMVLTDREGTLSDKQAAHEPTRKVVELSRKALKTERDELLEWIKAANRTHSKEVRKRVQGYFDELEERIKQLEKLRH